MFYSETAARSEAAHRIADKYGFPFIPLQGKFFELQKLTPDDKKYWLADGIHPTAAGHYMIGKALLNCFENNK